MAKPEWLKCEGCLWWDEEGINADAIAYGLGEILKNTNLAICRGGQITGASPKPTWFCSHWTCARCLESWDAIGDETFIDHSKCKEAEFE